MSRLKNVVGWMVRGGEQTRAELASQAAAIQALQQQVADMRESVDGQVVDRMRSEVRGALDDLVQRLGIVVDRLDALEARVTDLDDSVASLARVVAPPADS
jgi:uncharacterized coiled-coil protein SlyX